MDRFEKVAKKFVDQINWGLYMDGERFKNYVYSDLVESIRQVARETYEDAALVCENYEFPTKINGIESCASKVDWITKPIAEAIRKRKEELLKARKDGNQ